MYCSSLSSHKYTAKGDTYESSVYLVNVIILRDLPTSIAYSINSCQLKFIKAYNPLECHIALKILSAQEALASFLCHTYNDSYPIQVSSEHRLILVMCIEFSHENNLSDIVHFNRQGVILILFQLNDTYQLELSVGCCWSRARQTFPSCTCRKVFSFRLLNV